MELDPYRTGSHVFYRVPYYNRTTYVRTCACSNIVVVCRFRERKLTHIQYHISICRCFAWIVNNGAVALILLAIPLEKAALFSFRSSRTSREGSLHAGMQADGMDTTVTHTL